MLRDKNLIPLSHQHQHALALCVRIQRASPIPEADCETWEAEIAQQFESEIRIHFNAEERVLFPVARRFDELIPLVDELVEEHELLRKSFNRAKAQTLTSPHLLDFAERLAGHIRKEERQMFERLQELMSPEELARLGSDLAAALKDATQICAVPSEVTKLQPGKKPES